jgi:hypothetical protein
VASPRFTILLLLLVSATAAACREEKPRPIVIDGNLLTVYNETRDEWRDIEIWVNDHYRVTKSSMAAGERMSVPLDAFVEAYGRRFDWRRQPVFGVEVTAKAAGRSDVKIDWGKGRRR